MHMPHSYNEIEALILKWTFGTIFFGSILIFVVKMFSLVFIYVASGKVAIDLGAFVWKVITAMPR